MNKALSNALADAVAKLGEDAVLKQLEAIAKSLGGESSTLTIICDETLHAIPSEIIVGERFVFSAGNLDVSNEAALTQDLEQKLKRLGECLRSKRWSRVRLIFSGHSILPASVKMAVYRVTHIETEDIVYFGAAGYLRLNVDFRRVLGVIDPA